MTRAVRCRDADDVVRFLEGRLPDADAFEDHVDRCADCRVLVTELARAFDVDEAEPPDAEAWITRSGAELVERGMQIGRYVVLDPLGAGAMGVVYRAYDPELDRDVALKLVRVLTPDGVERARGRLAREAQAMAKLAHPNVVAVYDASALGEHVFVAMELVDGVDLQTWLAAGPRGWAAIVGAFVDAGRGLAAAHRAGILHRDFKPANVMVGADGRVRVGDFGLSANDGAHARGSPTDRGSRITADGTVIGTPAYMSPEVAAGAVGDDRSDQYSFAIALREALGDAAPARLAPVLARALRPDPAARYASMDALVDALERARVPRLRRAAPVAVVALAGVAAFAGYRLARAPQVEACEPPVEALSGIWDEARRAEIHRAFLATGVPHADEAWQRVERGLDEAAAVFLHDHVDTCASHARGTLTDEQFDLRVTCMQGELARFTATTAMYATADRRIVDTAIPASELAARFAPCRDVARLGDRTPPPLDPALRLQLAAATAELAAIEVASARGRYVEAAAGAHRIVEIAKQIGDARLEASALISLGESQWRSGDLAAAEQTLHRGIDAAKRARASDLEAGALLTLVAVLGWEDARYDEALRVARLAESTITAIGDDERLGKLLANRAAIAYARGDLASARADFARAHELLERVLGPRDRRVGQALMNLAMIEAEAGDKDSLERALGQYGRALAILEAQLGANHPEVALALANRAIALANLERRDEALRDAEHALAIRRERLGPQHRDVAMTLRLIGEIEHEAGDDAAALVRYRDALAIYERTLRPDHPELAPLHNSIGRALLAIGKPAQAIPSLERAIAIFEAAKIESTALAQTRFALARALWPHDRARVAKLVAWARRGYAGHDDDVARLDAWVKEHP